MPISTLNRVISWQWVHLIWASCERQPNHVIRLNYFKGNIYKIKIKYVKIPRIRPCSHEIVPIWKVLALAVPSKVRKKHLCVFLWYIEFFWQQIIYDAQPKYMQIDKPLTTDEQLQINRGCYFPQADYASRRLKKTFFFIRSFEKWDVLWEHLRQAGGRCPQGFRSLSQRDFIQSLSNLVNMLVGIISRPSSITCQIPPGSPELWPLNCPKTELAVSALQVEYPAPKIHL